MTAMMTREALAEALAQVGLGDRGAFERVYRATSAKLMGVALRILNDRALAEDVVQETYATVWDKAAGFDPGRASPITWMVTIARNRSIDRLRAMASRPTGGPLDAALTLVDDQPAADDRVQAGQEARQLHACLDELETHARDSIRTAFFDGETYESLAQAASVPLGTMKSWIRRGLKKLRECLER